MKSKIYKSKALIYTLLMMIMFTIINPITSFADSSKIEVKIDNVEGKAGESITVPVRLNNIPAGGIAATSIIITYDHTKLELTGISAGDIVSIPTDVRTYIDDAIQSAGKVKIYYSDRNAGLQDTHITSNGVLANLTFNIDSSASGDYTFGVDTTSEVTLTDTEATTIQYQDMTINNGKLSVNQTTNAAAPNITTQPTDKNVNVGDNANLTMAASGDSLSYQWYENTSNSTSGGTAINGATNATYAVPTTTAGTKYYYCVVTNTDSSATGNKTATSSVATVVVNECEYEFQPLGNGVKITKYKGTKTQVEIPETLDEKPVVSIGETVFYNKGLTSVTIPDSVTTIGCDAFKMNNLTSVAIPNSVTTIEAGAFASNKLSSVAIPNSVTTIEMGAFGRARMGPAMNVSSVTIPANVNVGIMAITCNNIDFKGYYDGGSKKAGEYKFNFDKNTWGNELTNAAAPNITTQPMDKNVNVGESINLTIAASGAEIRYQWYENTSNSTSGGTAISGATNATYAVPTTTAGTKYYYCVVTNTDSSATGNQTAVVTSNAAKVEVNELAQSNNIEITIGDETKEAGKSVTIPVSLNNVPNCGLVGTSIIVNYDSSKLTLTGISAGDIVPTKSDIVTDITDAIQSDGKVKIFYFDNTNAGLKDTHIKSNGVLANLKFNIASSADGEYEFNVDTKSDITGSDIKTIGYTAMAINKGKLKVTPKQSSGGGNSHSSGGSSSGKSNTTTQPQPNTGADVLVNGKAENAGTATTSKENNQTVTTIAVDAQKLEQKLKNEGNNSIVTIPVNTKSDVVVGQLTGDMVKGMENKQAVLEIKTDNASYKLPAQQIKIDDISNQLGKSVELKDIKVQVEISKPTQETVKVVEDAAKKGNLTIVAPAVEFEVTCIYNDKKIQVSRFNTYVERTVAIPDGVDLSKITTGVVVDPDGTTRHVPTKVIAKDGRYYAVINSLTNSTYSVIYHPITFNDVENHWSKNAVNDMGSRMVISGVGESKFEPDRDITRAEFATIIVRGLGLSKGNENINFTDINKSDWSYNAVATAYEYGIIKGYNDGTFKANEKIKREEAMAMIERAMKIVKLNANLDGNEVSKQLTKFTDANEVSDWAKSSVAACVNNNVVSGNNGKITAKQNITRAETATIVRNLLQKSDLINK